MNYTLHLTAACGRELNKLIKSQDAGTHEFLTAEKSDTVLACHLVFGYKHSFIYTSGFGCSSSIVADFSDVVVMEQTSVFDVDLLKAWAEMLFVKFLILRKISYKVTNNTKSNQQVVLTH